MKTVAAIVIFLFSFQLHASCRCTCVPTDTRLCESSYDLDNPCGVLCPGQGNNTPPGRTACPVVWVFNEMKGIYEWNAQCVE